MKKSILVNALLITFTVCSTSASAASFGAIFKLGTYFDVAFLQGPIWDRNLFGAEYLQEGCNIPKFRYLTEVYDDKIVTYTDPAEPERKQIYTMSDEGKILDVDLLFKKGHRRIQRRLYLTAQTENSLVYQAPADEMGRTFVMTFTRIGKDGLEGFATVDGARHARFRVTYFPKLGFPKRLAKKAAAGICSRVADCMRRMCPAKPGHSKL